MQTRRSHFLRRVLPDCRCIVREKLLSKELCAIYLRILEVVRLDVLLIEDNSLKQLANQGHFGCITRKGAKVGRLQQRAFLFTLSTQIKLVLCCTCTQFVELLGVPGSLLWKPVITCQIHPDVVCPSTLGNSKIRWPSKMMAPLLYSSPDVINDID